MLSAESLLVYNSNARHCLSCSFHFELSRRVVCFVFSDVSSVTVSVTFECCVVVSPCE